MIRYCAVIGHPVKHSASPAMQNAGFAALGLNWRYLAFDVAPSQLAAAISGAKTMRFIGLNLTVPHKLASVSLVDALDASAQTCAAVNTIRFEARDATGAWQPLSRFEEMPVSNIRTLGFNTDSDAIARALRDELGLNLAGTRVLLLGAGGAGRTAALRLAKEGVAELWLVNRTAERADALADEIRRIFPKVTARTGYPTGDVNLVINATSLGLKADDPIPLDADRFPLGRTKAVFDMVYRPAETRLLAAARSAGCRIANGLGMLLYQGAAALELWAGRGAPIDSMRRALEAEVYGT